MAALAPQAGYFPYAERGLGEGKGLVRAMAEQAAVVVGDNSPAFFFPRMLAAATAATGGVHFEVVDAAGLVPVELADRPYPSAHTFRRWLQRVIPDQLDKLSHPEPLSLLHSGSSTIPEELLSRWPPLSAASLNSPADIIREIQLPAGAPSEVALRGGARWAHERLAQFVDSGLDLYAEYRSSPAHDAASGLSPWLHYGHIAVEEIFTLIAQRNGWNVLRLAPAPTGRKSGWWGMDANSEAFLDELITWRELGLNAARHLDGWTEYRSLPQWALATLDAHRGDRRPHLYTLEQLENGATADPLWNAAQRELVRTGTIQNYLRMLWGKKILEWSPTPEESAARMIELNNRYALDGRDPNSYSGIYWCLGRYDRPWGPTRPVFGTVRYMTSANTARKFDVKGYLKRFAE